MKFESGPLLERQCRAFAKFVRSAENITSIDLSGLGWVGEEEQRPDAIASVLPTFPAFQPRCLEGEGCILGLHPAIKELAERHHVLNREVIQAFGKECSEVQNHPLAQIADLLQEQGISQEVPEEWNRRFVSKKS